MIVFQMIKTPTGTTIYEFDENGEVLDTYRYDSNGNPIDTVESKDRFGNTVIKPKIYEGAVVIREPSGELDDNSFDMYYDSLMKAGIPEDIYRGAIDDRKLNQIINLHNYYRTSNSDDSWRKRQRRHKSSDTCTDLYKSSNCVHNQLCINDAQFYAILDSCRGA